MIALRSFAGLRENARRHGVDLPPGFDDRLAAPPSSPATAAGPTARSRRSRTPTAATTRRCSSCSASSPPTTARTSRTAATSRSASDDRFLIFDCGPLGDGGHGHYDLLSFEAWAGGRPLIVDPGRYTYAEGEPNLRHWFKGTAAHNTVCVDRLDQTPYARKAPKGPTAEPRFLGRTKDQLAGEARSPAYEAVHRRTITFVDAPLGDRGHAHRRGRAPLRPALPPAARRCLHVRLGRAGARPGAGDRRRRRDRDRARLGLAPLRRQARAPVVSAVARGRDATFRTELLPR